MKKILIVCVNYNSYQELHNYLASIERAAQLCPNVKVEVIVADNSTKEEEINTTSFVNISVSVRKYDNLGYLGAAQEVINKCDDLTVYDFVAISNVDLRIKEDFVCKLDAVLIDNDVAWIAPTIWSECEGRNRNPKVMQRYSRRKLEIINLMYRFPLLDWIYTNTAYKKKKEQSEAPEQNIYAGHGSFMLLTKHFFERHSKIQYPIFLFGEELYLAELIRESNQKVLFAPKLVVYDTEHVSTGSMKKKFYYKCNKEAIEYIIKKFYE